MLTTSDFLDRIDSLIPQFPAIEARYRAGDPTIKFTLTAIATMLAMQSAEQEVSFAEPFEKTRDATVLADASLRGILPMASPAVVSVLVENGGPTAHTLESGRLIYDAVGRPYTVIVPAYVPAGGSASCSARQEQVVTTTHTVSGTSAFYQVEVPELDDDSSISSVSVLVDGDLQEYRARFVNTGIGDAVYSLEVDANRTLYVRFGMSEVVGIQPVEGSVVTIQTGYSFGVVQPAVDSPFTIGYLLYAEDAYLKLSMQELSKVGVDRLSISELRELAKYPTAYDKNAVYLGEFDFLVRRHMSPQFLSVWNETAEEAARGANIINHNCLFVAAYFGSESLLTGASAPDQIANDSLTDDQKTIADLITAADDSYRIRFFTPVIQTIPITVTAMVPTSYVASVVRAQIIELLIDQYGKGSERSKRGRMRPSNRAVFSLLQSGIAALSVDGADFTVSVPAFSESVRPELWRYVDEGSLTVTVSTRNTAREVWG